MTIEQSPNAPFSKMAGTLIGSEILKIAAEINTLKAAGQNIINFTVGDFDPKYFPIPESLKSLIQQSLQRDETNYPPSSGVADLRKAVAEFYTREFGLPTSVDEVLIAGGARPLIYTIFTTVLDPGDNVIFPVPSWNNNHYVHLSRCTHTVIECKAENGFLPTAAELVPHLPKARLLCLNSPLNPTGTAFSAQALRDISELVLRENERRLANGERPLYVMYDQIYWKLTHGDTRHVHPLQVCPELKPWTLFVDGMSKYFCGTGLRVGWSVLPKELMPAFSNVLGHVGAWAPKPEQAAVAEFLQRTSEVDAYIAKTCENVQKRLVPLYEGIQAMKRKGLPVDAIRPQGAIYLSVKIGEPGQRTDEQTRQAILHKAGLAIVPFQAFGLKQDTAWFRISVGAVSEAEIRPTLGRLEKFLTHPECIEL